MANELQMIQAISNANNAWSAEQAKKQMDFQKEMSNTAHQREVADLKKAGLNPVLSALNGNGASTPSGAMGDTDTSNTTAFASIIGKMLDIEDTNAKANLLHSAYGSGSGLGYEEYKEAKDLTTKDLTSLGISFGAAQVATAMVNAIKSGDMKALANTIDTNSKVVSENLGNKEPPNNTSAKKAMEYKLRTGNSSTEVGLSAVQKAINKVVGAIKGYKR